MIGYLIPSATSRGASCPPFLSRKRSHLKGQWSTLVSPFTPAGSLDSNGLTSNINHIVDLGVSGIGCTWGMGEFWSLTLEERMRIYDLVAEHAGDKVKIETRRGKVEVKVRLDRNVPNNVIFFPFAFKEAPANILTNPKLDPYGKIPEFKYCAAKMEKISKTSSITYK